MIVVWIVAIAYIGWYVYLDWLSSRIMAYSFPHACVNCGLSEKPLSSKVFDRVYGISFDNDVLKQFFPVAYREAKVPICRECKQLLDITESSMKTQEGITLIISTLVLTAALWYPTYSLVGTLYAGLKGVVGTTIFALIPGVLLGAVVEAFVMNLRRRILRYPPVAFDYRGNIRFKNSDYLSRFRSSGKARAYRFKQKTIPHGIFMGMIVYIVISILMDVGELSAIDSGIRTLLLIVMGLKLFAIIVFYQSYYVFAFTIWLPAFILDFYLNKANALENFDELAVGIAVISIMLYEWRQTRKDADNSTLKKGEINIFRCQCGQVTIFVCEDLIHNYLTGLDGYEDSKIVNLNYSSRVVSCSNCQRPILRY